MLELAFYHHTHKATKTGSRLPLVHVSVALGIRTIDHYSGTPG